MRIQRSVFGQTEEESGYIDVRKFVTTPAQVTVALGNTINLGNYESAKITVSVSMPCYSEEVTQTQEEVFSIVESFLEKKVKEVIDSVGRNRNG